MAMPLKNTSPTSTHWRASGYNVPDYTQRKSAAADCVRSATHSGFIRIVAMVRRGVWPV